MSNHTETITHDSFSPLTPHPSPLTPHPSPLTPHPSPLTPHPSPLTPHPSPLTPHPSPLTSAHLPVSSRREETCSVIPLRDNVVDHPVSTIVRKDCSFLSFDNRVSKRGRGRGIEREGKGGRGEAEASRRLRERGGPQEITWRGKVLHSKSI